MLFTKNKSLSISQTVFSLSLTVLISYMIFNMLVGGYVVIYPLLKRSVDNFSNLIIENTKTWETSTPSQQRQLKEQLFNTQNIIISKYDIQQHQQSTSFLPYNYLLREALEQKSKTPVDIDYYPNNTHQYVITLHRETPLFIHFSSSRIGTSPPLIILSIFLSSIVLSIFASYFLSHRLHRCFQPLINASLKLSKGEEPALIDEKGPTEIQLLAKSFNNMSRDVQTLLQNRTTLLAGVSHNLRTPVTRLKLGLELLPESTDVELRKKIDRSLDEINRTITQFLDMAEGMKTLQTQACDVNTLLKDLISRFSHYEGKITFEPDFDISYQLAVPAFEQILMNLIENSLRFSDNKPVLVKSTLSSEQFVVQVIDQGPGIPENIKDTIFQPFVSQQHTNNNVANNTGTNLGLGLAICQIMAKAHLWELTVQSVETGGTCSTLTLPASAVIETHRYKKDAK